MQETTRSELFVPLLCTLKRQQHIMPSISTLQQMVSLMKISF